MNTECTDQECWCSCHGDEYDEVVYDPNYVWHGPKTRTQQMLADAYNPLLEHALQPMLFFDRFATKEVVL